MDNREAIERFEAKRNKLARTLELIKQDDPYSTDRTGHYYTAETRALESKDAEKELCFIDLAIQSLKKQVPMKPNPANWSDMVCPVCGNFVSHYDNKEAYCRVCGQAIDWSDVT